jgi:hypothetical protein
MLQQRDRDDWEPITCNLCGAHTRGVPTLMGIAVDRHLMPSGRPCWKSV